ncbi:unnamed protein product [Aphanomyces euteiches]
MAYLTEPRPGQTLPSTLPASMSFDEYVNHTSAYLQQLYNNETLSSSLSNRRDLATNTFGIRRDMAMPACMSEDDALSLLPHIPCLQINEQPETVWIKFVFRLLLSLYILYVLWSQYYRHYKTLQLQLRQRGLSSAHSRYEIVVGDPAYVIMSNWTILLAMIVDTWLGVGYTTVAASRVWCAYLGMRVMSSVVKWRRWEASFAPIDPSILAIMGYVYTGPMVSILNTPQMVKLYQTTWSTFLPPALEKQAIESVTGTKKVVPPRLSPP